MASLALKVAVVALVFSSSVAAALIPPPTHVEHEKRHEVGDAFVKRSRLEGHFELPDWEMLCDNNKSNLEYGHDKLMEISDPTSSKFGRHYTGDEIDEFFAPSPDTVAAVRAWVEKTIESGRISLSINRQWIQFDAAASELEALLHTSFHYYDNHATGASRLGCDRYHVPAAIRHHIDYITPGVKHLNLRNGFSLGRRDVSQPPGRSHLRPMVKPLGISEKDLESMTPSEMCKHGLTPFCIKQLYGIHDTPPNGTGNTIGIFEAIGQFYSQADLKKYFQTFAKFIPPNTLPMYRRVDGAPKAGTKPPGEPIEANLDLQVSFPLAFPSANVVNFQIDDLHYEETFKKFGAFNNFLDAIDGSYCDFTAFGITGNSPKFDPSYPDPSNKTGSFKGNLECGKFKPTNVLSFSFGEAERLFPMAYQRRQCNEFMKLGLQGTSLILSSGDAGVEADFDPGNGDCNAGPPLGFGVNYHLNCPMGETEVASTSFESGGGFSNIYPRPQYQQNAVHNYLTHHKPSYPSYNVSFMPEGGMNGGRYNRGGRAYPDVSAVAELVLGFSGGKMVTFNGTSVSAPLFAGIITRINSHRLAAGKKPLGFLNPMLYANPDMFRDIVTGHNEGCNTKGFFCAPKWDPVTGLGTPNYPKMLKILTSLP